MEYIYTNHALAASDALALADASRRVFTPADLASLRALEVELADTAQAKARAIDRSAYDQQMREAQAEPGLTAAERIDKLTEIRRQMDLVPHKQEAYERAEAELCLRYRPAAVKLFDELEKVVAKALEKAETPPADDELFALDPEVYARYKVLPMRKLMDQTRALAAGFRTGHCSPEDPRLHIIRSGILTAQAAS